MQDRAAHILTLQASVQVMQNLLALGAIGFAVRIDCSRLDMLPEARILHGLPSEALVRPDGTVLNTCTSSALVSTRLHMWIGWWIFEQVAKSFPLIRRLSC